MTDMMAKNRIRTSFWSKHVKHRLKSQFAMPLLAMLCLSSGAAAQGAGMAGAQFGSGATVMREVLRSAETASPKDQSRPLVVAREAAKLAASGDLTRASRLANEALQMQPMNSGLHLLNALIYHLMAQEGNSERLDTAIEGYDQVLRLDQSSLIALELKGHAHVLRRQFAQAQQAFAEAAILRPRDATILSKLMAVSYLAGDPVTACGVADQASKLMLGLSPKDQDAFLRGAANVYASCGQQQAAARVFAQLAERGMSADDLEDLRQRGQQWDLFYASRAKPIKAQLKTGAAGAPAAAPAANTAEPAAPAGEPSNAAAAAAAAAAEQAPAAGPAPAAAVGGFRASNCGGLQPIPSSTAGGGGGFAVLGPGQMPVDPAAAAPQDPAAAAAAAAPSGSRMVLIDVVMVRTEDSLSTRKGVNLLNALTLQAGYTNTREVARTAGAWDGGTTKITRAITVPALTYSLNIANAGNNLNEVLARPTLAALECQKSEFFSGNSLSAAVVSSAMGGGAVTVDRRYGVKLTVVPEILADGQVKLNIDASRTFIKPPSQNIEFTYKIEISEIVANASVVMRMGDTLILGGLSEKESTSLRSGVPGLQDVPLLQYLFSTEEKSDYQKSVLMLITPRPATYTWMTAESQKINAANQDAFTPSLDVLRARYSDWFRPYPNLASVFYRMNLADLYREFRTGDVTLENWDRNNTTVKRLNQALQFLHY